MKGKIAIEPNLTPFKDYLSSKGLQVEDINLNQSSVKENNNYDAYVVTGLNSNFLGMNDTGTKAVVIDASGLTPEEVYNKIQSTLS